jgi:hypothetical protein
MSGEDGEKQRSGGSAEEVKRAGKGVIESGYAHRKDL